MECVKSDLKKVASLLIVCYLSVTEIHTNLSCFLLPAIGTCRAPSMSETFIEKKKNVRDLTAVNNGFVRT